MSQFSEVQQFKQKTEFWQDFHKGKTSKAIKMLKTTRLCIITTIFFDIFSQIYTHIHTKLAPHLWWFKHVWR